MGLTSPSEARADVAASLGYSGIDSGKVFVTASSASISSSRCFRAFSAAARGAASSARCPGDRVDCVMAVAGSQNVVARYMADLQTRVIHAIGREV